MGIIVDPVDEQINFHLQKNGYTDIWDAIREGMDGRFANPDDEGEGVRKLLETLYSLITATCTKHASWKLLFLFRKFPSVSYKLLEGIFTARENQISISPIFNESIVFGTNAILKYSQVNHDLNECADRFKFKATDQELKDTIRLMVFSILHRTLMFRLNSISHTALQEDKSYLNLLDVYNQRQELRIKPPAEIRTVNDAVICVRFIGHVPTEGKKIGYKNRTGYETVVIPKNYYPYLVAGLDEFEKYSGLNCPEFEALTKVSFDHWWKIWLSLNQTIKNNVAFLWSQEETAASTDFELRAGAERADDYSDTALGCGFIPTIVKTCHELLKRKYGTAAPLLNECERFFDFLCCDQLPGDPRFVEQPFIFYRVGPDRAYWDYLRHNGVMRAVIRRLFSDKGKAVDRLRTQVALRFEKQVKNKIEKSLSMNTNDIKLNLKIKNSTDGQTVWEIDSAFIYRDILFIVETKNWLKSERYYLADDPVLSSRASNWEAVLQKQDENLQKHKLLLTSRWDKKITGAICIVCTESVEFTSSLDSKWWLNVGKTPRICLVDELIDYLKSENLEELHRHPNLVRLDT
jgi:hypothetical protein